MKIIGKNISITEGIRAYCEKKLAVTDEDIRVTVRSYKQGAKATIFIEALNIRAEATSDDLYSAIDELSDKADRQIKKMKKKKENYKHQSHKEIADAIEKENPLEDLMEKLISTKEIPDIQCSVKDALEKIDELDYGFYLFRNEEGIPCVAYRKSEDATKFGLLKLK